ncbi:MAG: hypothetical protein JRE12_13205 [Deltaproteobacteria bacterium]|nr:hypothetical protein [Deltaproteobacteria bacterium]
MSDAQAGHEKSISALLPALAGANLIYGAGMLEAGDCRHGETNRQRRFPG